MVEHYFHFLPQNTSKWCCEILFLKALQVWGDPASAGGVLRFSKGVWLDENCRLLWNGAQVMPILLSPGLPAQAFPSSLLCSPHGSWRERHFQCGIIPVHGKDARQLQCAFVIQTFVSSRLQMCALGAEPWLGHGQDTVLGHTSVLAGDPQDTWVNITTKIPENICVFEKFLLCLCVGAI